jgi:hypothetical protein
MKTSTNFLPEVRERAVRMVREHQGGVGRRAQGDRRDGAGADPRGTGQSQGYGHRGEATATYDQAAGIFEKMSLSPEYPEFLTLPLYEAMD